MDTLLDTSRSTSSLLTETDSTLFKSGMHYHLYEKLGSHIVTLNNVTGTFFAVWAPNAKEVSVIGDFNNWNASINPLTARQDNSGIWETFLPQVTHGAMYKYSILSRYNNYRVEKRDPFSFSCEQPPQRASLVWDLAYRWNDAGWIRNRPDQNSLNAPMSIYEMHFGSWRRRVEESSRFLNYDEMATELISYIKEMGFTHVEFMPLTAHPLYESWGYQTDGYFAPTARYGTPQMLMSLIDRLHQNNIGTILDWVPSHFPQDRHGLAFFDGTHLYEHADPRQGFHPEWKSSIFNYGRPEVKEFLISSALFWLEKYHFDGLRVDGGSSMLYLDYGRKRGEWIPNKHGGRENLEAVDFLKALNTETHHAFPDVQIAVEEATCWPNISRATSQGGLGFNMKWNMGWMHDTLKYLAVHPSQRKNVHSKLTFSLWYAFNENFLLALSHDEVVHGKKSLLSKMPGDDWQKFANLRLLFGYMYGHPGKKLLFMGSEFGQWSEWSEKRSLDWHLTNFAPHQGVQRWVRDLNATYRREAALFNIDFTENGFEWIDFCDWNQSVISFLRKGKAREDLVLVVCNFTPTPRYTYRIGVPDGGYWKEILNSDAKEYGGSGTGNMGGVQAEVIPFHHRAFSVALTLPPLSVSFFKPTFSRKIADA